MDLLVELLSAGFAVTDVFTRGRCAAFLQRDDGRLFFIFFIVIDLLPDLYFSRLNSLHPNTFLSSPTGEVHLYGNNWLTSPGALFKASFHHFFLVVGAGGGTGVFFYFFIYLAVLNLHPHPHFFLFKCVWERELCYLSGTVISWALLSWLDPAPAVPSTQWMISCPPLEGKSWFLSPRNPAHPPKPIVLLLYQFSSQYLSHLISFCLLSTSFYFSSSHLSYFYSFLCL